MASTKVDSPIKLTSQAVQELNKIRNNETVPADHVLRVGVKGGGCAGFSYILGFDTPTDTDNHYESEGMDIIVDKGHLMHVAGIEIDFEDGLNHRGFVFNNPNATETCGCGTSFAT